MKEKKGYYNDGRRFAPYVVIRDWNLNFNLGSAVKYISRQGRKESADKSRLEKDIDDLKKAITYLEFEIEELERQLIECENE